MVVVERSRVRAADPLTRLREVCLALPDAHEVEAWGEPTFRINNKIFAMYAGPDSHHGKGRPAVWAKATPTDQELLLKANPQRFFFPPYVGPSGWIGIWLDKRPSWKEIAVLIADAYEMTVPKKKKRK